MPIRPQAKPGGDAARTRGRPRLGVLATHPIQYQAPLYQQLARRGVVHLDVAFLSDAGARPFHDPGFGVTLAWDIDLLSGYRSSVLGRRALAGKAAWLVAASRWLSRQDIVVLHGHSDPEMLLAAAACRLLGVPYLLRGDSQAESSAASLRRMVRHVVAGAVVRNAAGALPIGQRNAAFYHRYGRIPHYLAPYSVDNDRFRDMSGAARPSRTQRLTSLGLDPQRPTVIFSGKLMPHKRPLDVIRAIERSAAAFNLLLLGDGPMRAELREYEEKLPVRCLGFINQAEMPGWYGTGDILALPSGHEPWGLVVNEGMACGLIPVVSDAVGCGPDLARGVGEVFPVGDVDALAAALTRVAADVRDRRERITDRLAGFTIAETAAGYEQAATELRRRRLCRPFMVKHGPATLSVITITPSVQRATGEGLAIRRNIASFFPTRTARRRAVMRSAVPGAVPWPVMRRRKRGLHSERGSALPHRRARTGEYGKGGRPSSLP
jgi:glycosyltransferase involved in cell wall biosynthesis